MMKDMVKFFKASTSIKIWDNEKVNDDVEKDTINHNRDKSNPE